MLATIRAATPRSGVSLASSAVAGEGRLAREAAFAGVVAVDALGALAGALDEATGVAVAGSAAVGVVAEAVVVAEGVVVAGAAIPAGAVVVAGAAVADAERSGAAVADAERPGAAVADAERSGAGPFGVGDPAARTAAPCADPLPAFVLASLAVFASDRVWAAWVSPAKASAAGL
jgi:hypothetical protein